MASHKGYEFFEHTADAGVRVYGKTLRELFVNAAAGLTANNNYGNITMVIIRRVT